MSKEKWSDSKTNKFIESYIHLTPLWNVSDPDYAVRTKKQDSYKELQDQFGLTLNEVKNKIRIYRTTYGQAVKAMESNGGVAPKLSWFHDLHKAFQDGKIKSFKKLAKKPKLELSETKLVEIDYREDSTETSDGEKKEIKFAVNKIGSKRKSDHHQIIIERYEDEYEDEVEYQQMAEPAGSSSMNHEHLSTLDNETSSFMDSGGMQSNELFLKSLQSTLDKLPDDKNMRARIKIQQILYELAYEK